MISTTRQLGLYIKEGTSHNEALGTAIREGFVNLRGYHLSLFSIDQIQDKGPGEQP